MDKTNYITKFSLNQKVCVSKGFYQGMIGKIKDVEKNKDETYTYTIEVEEKETGKIKTIKVPQNLLRPLLFGVF